jgi:hypothetical protein
MVEAFAWRNLSNGEEFQNGKSAMDRLENRLLHFKTSRVRVDPFQNFLAQDPKAQKRKGRCRRDFLGLRSLRPWSLGGVETGCCLLPTQIS